MEAQGARARGGKAEAGTAHRSDGSDTVDDTRRHRTRGRLAQSLSRLLSLSLSLPPSPSFLSRCFPFSARLLGYVAACPPRSCPEPQRSPAFPFSFSRCSSCASLGVPVCWAAAVLLQRASSTRPHRAGHAAQCACIPQSDAFFSFFFSFPCLSTARLLLGQRGSSTVRAQLPRWLR